MAIVAGGSLRLNVQAPVKPTMASPVHSTSVSNKGVLLPS